MKRNKSGFQRGLALVCAVMCGILCACGQGGQKPAGWRAKEVTVIDDNYRTWYEIFVGSFCDSDGDQTGDLQGVISKLDYIEDLGFNGIWLMPIMPSNSYHKYDVKDYMSIDPAYGTMEDFDELAAACNERGSSSSSIWSSTTPRRTTPGSRKPAITWPPWDRTASPPPRTASITATTISPRATPAPTSGIRLGPRITTMRASSPLRCRM